MNTLHTRIWQTTGIVSKINFPLKSVVLNIYDVYSEYKVLHIRANTASVHGTCINRLAFDNKSKKVDYQILKYPK